MTSRALVIVVALALTAEAAPPLVDDRGHGYSFVLPDGYSEFAEGRAAPRVLQSFMRGQPHEPSFGVLRVEALGGTIGREPLNRATVEKAARDSVRGSGIEVLGFAYQPTRWRGFPLEVVATQLVHDGEKLMTLGVQVPLRREAIQIYFMGPAADEARLHADLAQILGSLRGESSWLTDDERSERLGFGVGLAAGLLGLTLWFWRRRRARRKVSS